MPAPSHADRGGCAREAVFKSLCMYGIFVQRNPPSRESGATHAAGKAGEAGALDAGIPTPQKLSPDELRAWASALNQEQHILNRFAGIIIHIHSNSPLGHPGTRGWLARPAAVV